MRDGMIVMLGMLLIAGLAIFVALRLDYQLQMHGMQTELKRLSTVAVEQSDHHRLHQQAGSAGQRNGEMHRPLPGPLPALAFISLGVAGCVICLVQLTSAAQVRESRTHAQSDKAFMRERYLTMN